MGHGKLCNPNVLTCVKAKDEHEKNAPEIVHISASFIPAPPAEQSSFIGTQHLAPKLTVIHNNLH